MRPRRIAAVAFAVLAVACQQAPSPSPDLARARRS